MTWMGESSIGECFFLASISTSCSTIIICNILYIKCNILCIKCSTRSPWQSPCLSNILNMLCKIYWIYHVKYIEYIHLSCSSSICTSCCLPLILSRRAECWVWGLICICICFVFVFSTDSAESSILSEDKLCYRSWLSFLWLHWSKRKYDSTMISFYLLGRCMCVQQILFGMGKRELYM